MSILGMRCPHTAGIGASNYIALGTPLSRWWLRFVLASNSTCGITHHDVVPKSLPRPGKTALALRLELDDGSGLDLTEAGKQRNLSVYLTEDPENVPGIAALGPDALDELTVEELGTILHEAGGAQLKGVLRNQRLIAGIGNAFPTRSCMPPN